MTRTMTSPDAILTTTTPAGVSTTHPVSPSWASVAPLLARWQMALFPHGTDSWHVVTFWLCRSESMQHTARRVRFADLPQAIADVAARCENDAREKGEGRRVTGEGTSASHPSDFTLHTSAAGEGEP